MKTSHGEFTILRQRIGIFRALKLGDLLCAVPALRAVRRHFPMHEITLIGLPWAREFAEQYRHLIDDFIEFPGHPSFPERDFRSELFPEFISKCLKKKFSLMFQMQGNGTVINSHMPGEYFKAPHD